MEHPTVVKGPKIVGPGGTKFGGRRMNAATLTVDVVTERMSMALRKSYGGDAKAVARDAAGNVETAQNWLNGRNSMSLTMFFRLCRNNPDLWAEARRVIAMDAEMDPETEAAVLGLVIRIQRQQIERTRAELEAGK